MTVSTTNNRKDYLGNGTAGPFPYNFKIFSASHLYVYVDGVLKTLGTHYTVSGVGNPAGGNVTFTSGNEPPVNAKILLLRVLPVTQLSDYVNHDAFNAETLESDLDKVVMIAQQFLELVERVVKLPVESTITGLTLPEAINGGELFRWKTDKSGLELVNVGPADALNVITTQGDIITGGSGGIPKRLAVGTAKQVLKSQGTGADIAWGNEADAILTTRGDILYRGSTSLERLPAGTPGQILTTRGSSNDPDWANNTRRIIFPAACFETRVGTGWAEFVQVQGTNFDFGELRFDAANEQAFTPPFRITNWDEGNVTVKVGFKTNATSGSVTWEVGLVGRDTTTPEAWDASVTTHSMGAKSVPGTAEWLVESVWTGSASELAKNDAVIMRIRRTDTPGPPIAKLLYVEFEYNIGV